MTDGRCDCNVFLWALANCAATTTTPTIVHSRCNDLLYMATIMVLVSGRLAAVEEGDEDVHALIAKRFSS